MKVSTTKKKRRIKTLVEDILRILCCADTAMLPPVQNRSSGQDSTTEHLPSLGVLR